MSALARERCSTTQSPTYTMYQGAQAAIRALGFTRGELLRALSILGCANGLAAKVILSVRRLGWVDAAIGTFEVNLSGCVLHRHIVGFGRQDRRHMLGRPRGRDGSPANYRSSNRRNELAGCDHVESLHLAFYASGGIAASRRRDSSCRHSSQALEPSCL